ncbi:MAG: hypothetical protein OXG13_13155 [Gemmatimonadaceae bacterium]|nr:hypothetical protein [Gemmatimonadaceae bacterium]
MRGRSLIFVAIILPAGALAQDSALDAITHEQTDLRAENRFTAFEGRGGTPVPSGEIVGSRAALIPCQKTRLNL